MSEGKDVTGGSQAASRLGDTIPVTKDARSKTYVNCVRLNMGQFKKIEQRTDINAIYKTLVSKFGANSALVRTIIGISKSVEQTWIIRYKTVPEGLIDQHITLNGKQVLVEDAKITADVYDTKRSKKADEDKANAYKDITFKIQGLPLDIEQKESYDCLVKLGFESLKIENVRCMYENFNGHYVRNGVLLFKIACNSENRKRMIALIGDHQIRLDDYIWKTSVNCFGFCIGCKVEGHKIQDCPNKPVIKCHFCEVEGHVKKDCQAFLAEIKKKKENSTCFKCRKKGHYGRDCQEKPLGWNLDIEEFPILANGVSSYESSDETANNTKIIGQVPKLNNQGVCNNMTQKSETKGIEGRKNINSFATKVNGNLPIVATKNCDVKAIKESGVSATSTPNLKRNLPVSNNATPEQDNKKLIRDDDASDESLNQAIEEISNMDTDLINKN